MAAAPVKQPLRPATQHVAQHLVLLLQVSENGGNPFQGAMNKIGSGLIKLGEDLKGAGEHLGGMFVGLGNRLRTTMYVHLPCRSNSNQI